MIELKNIEIDGDIVKCEIFPEDSTIGGSIKVDVSENKIISFVLPSGYEWCKNHLEHAKRYLVMNFKNIQMLPISEQTLVWY